MTCACCVCAGCKKSIDASSHKLLADTIRRLGYEAEFTITQNSIKAKSGAEFRFLGFQSNLDSIKSIEGVDICWVEEAHAISAEAWETPHQRYAVKVQNCGLPLTRRLHGMKPMCGSSSMQKMTGSLKR